MPDLVADFVEQLFQLERAEHDVGSTLVAGDELPRRPAPPAQELLARLGEALGLRRPASPSPGAGGVGERSQHAGHVLERGVFRPPLLESARGLALEVEDEPLAFAAKHLSEMEIAVLADPHSARLRGRERPDPLFEERLAGLDLRNGAARNADGLVELAKEVLAPADEVLADDRLGSEGRIGRIGGERGVHLADTRPEVSNLLERQRALAEGLEQI